MPQRGGRGREERPLPHWGGWGLQAVHEALARGPLSLRALSGRSEPRASGPCELQAAGARRNGGA